MTTKKNEKTPEATAPETNERSPAFAIPGARLWADALDRSVARAEQALEWAEAFDTRAREQVDAYITESTRLQQETSQYANRLADDFRSASLDALRRSADVLRG